MISKKLDLAIKLNFHKIISLKKSKVGGVGYINEGELNAMKKKNVAIVCLCLVPWLFDQCRQNLPFSNVSSFFAPFL